MKNTLLILLITSKLSLMAQHELSEKYVVTANDDTTWCSEIKLKSMSITCQTAIEKVEIRNETVRRIYMPIAKSEWSGFFESYAKSQMKDGYLYAPKLVQQVLAAKIYTRFFDLKPIDPDNDFWTRGLFEILVENNGLKLCKLKEVKSSRPSIANAPDENLDKYIIFEENKGKGTTLNKNNYESLLTKLFANCDNVLQALNSKAINPLKEMPQFLALFGTCK